MSYVKKVLFFLLVISRSNTFACKDNIFIVMIETQMIISSGNDAKPVAKPRERIHEADKQERWVAPEKFWQEKFHMKENEVTYKFNWGGTIEISRIKRVPQSE